MSSVMHVCKTHFAHAFMRPCTNTYIHQDRGTKMCFCREIHTFVHMHTYIHTYIRTEEEKRVFVEKFVDFASRPEREGVKKNFYAISKYLPNKSARDCVSFYYLNKKTKYFKVCAFLYVCMCACMQYII
jgi:hypothetical protein